MSNFLKDLSDRIEFGKVDLESVYPPQYKGQPGADEMTAQALIDGFSPEDILHKSLIKGMERVGVKFRENRNGNLQKKLGWQQKRNWSHCKCLG